MSLFHKHKWIEKERFYAATEKVIEVGTEGEEPQKRLAFGITTIHFVCECGEHRFEKILGKRIRGRGKKEVKP